MILLVDSGNTHVKWQLLSAAGLVGAGRGALEDSALFEDLRSLGSSIRQVAVSTVGADDGVDVLCQRLARVTSAPVRCYWSERERSGLRNSYEDVSRMGADRWHAMLAAWCRYRCSLMVIDAGTALTADYVDGRGQHLGGFIVPGLQMMRKSLNHDAARIGFQSNDTLECDPGRSTSECVNNGLNWFLRGLILQIREDVAAHSLERIVITGGDARRLTALGLEGDVLPDLVFEGLELVVREEAGQ
ncbi:type III pantothenate kinase [Marinobacter oulmenensis]|uniref:Type III pantothenate kinase n=1 Tax=Marinobacter oulmenensis TaxID=643747 RepID=A0A840UN97_9GAMM|nr:type III pantothenate kinase [Marinobacter oulmenensis]MBB5322317.1 type III pantothenate kinase [Marinobacter oulmenensis]